MVESQMKHANIMLILYLDKYNIISSLCFFIKSHHMTSSRQKSPTKFDSNSKNVTKLTLCAPDFQPHLQTDIWSHSGLLVKLDLYVGKAFV